MKRICRTLVIIHLFVGIGALAGGLAAIINPISPMGIPADSLRNSPFSDFLIPGVILFGFIGMGNIFGAFAFRFKLRLQGYISAALGGGLAIWIIVQCIMLWAVVPLHVIYFIIGLMQGGLALALLSDQNTFPFDLFKKCSANEQRKPQNARKSLQLQMIFAIIKVR